MKYDYIIDGDHAVPTEHFRAGKPKLLVWDNNEKKAKVWIRKPNADSSVGLELEGRQTQPPAITNSRANKTSMVAQQKGR